MNDKEALIKSDFSVEVSCSDGKKVIWYFVDDHVVYERNGHDEIGVQGFGFNLFDEGGYGVFREEFSVYTYLFILTKIWPGDWNNHLERINMKVDKENGKSPLMVNGRYQEVWRFSSNEF